MQTGTRPSESPRWRVLGPLPSGSLRSNTLGGDRLTRLLRPFLIVCVLILPLQVPRWSYNIVSADLALIAFVVLAAVMMWRSRIALRVPLGASFFLVVVAGMIATTQSVVPIQSAAAVIQDVYLFLWFVFALNLIRIGGMDLARRVAVVWSYVGVVVASALWAVSLVFPERIPLLFGYATMTSFGRVQGGFEDPNLAGFYLVVTLFVMWASPRPRRTWMKLIWSVPFLLAIQSTESITALAAVVGGGLVALTIAFVSRREAAVAVSLALFAIGMIVVASLPSDFGQRPVGAIDRLGHTPVFSESLGRSNRSFTQRATRWQEGLRFFGAGVIIGIGPSATDDALFAAGAPLGGELHNDYVAGFLERGVAGGIGVLSLFVVAGVWAVRVGTDKSLRGSGWRPAAFVGGMVTILLSAMTLETLHFRHIWVFFALLMGLALRRAPAPLPEEES